MMNILVVDDEPLIHISIEKLIQSGEKGVSVFHAYNGREMLERLAEHHFSLAYVDIKMPGISGLEALKKAREISPFTSYYIMTGFDEFEYAIRQIAAAEKPGTQKKPFQELVGKHPEQTRKFIWGIHGHLLLPAVGHYGYGRNTKN